MTTWTETLRSPTAVASRSFRASPWRLPLAGVKVVSTDVFDTILVRRPVSERTRIVRAETRFSHELATAGFPIDADLLVEARLQAQALAFRALDVGGHAGEVRALDVIARQLRLLGLSPALASQRLRLEIEVEKQCLKADIGLAEALRLARASGLRVIAVSDTTLPATSVAELIEHFHGTGLVDAVYSSADSLATKREGTLFGLVAQSEGVLPGEILHIGDDALADDTRPRKAGIGTVRVHRSRIRRLASRADGLRTELVRLRRRQRRTSEPAVESTIDAEQFGRVILGPIAVELCQRIWLYATAAQSGDRPVLLFCARGGVGIREVFERVLVRLRLPLEVPRQNLLVSRLVAARLAVACKSAAAGEELRREFADRSLSDAARALGGGHYKLDAKYDEPFGYERFISLLDCQSGARVAMDIAKQNLLFRRHLDEVANGGDRLILCDTGLYGSTQRLLSEALPDHRFETLQLARSNYKGHSESHFAKVVGLCVQQRHYDPVTVESAVLRYWHLIERLFEIDVPSVRTFSESADCNSVANCGNIAFGQFDARTGNALLRGAIGYVDSLPVDGGGIVAFYDAERAWRELHRVVIRPNPSDIRCIGEGDRSIDFGRDGRASIIASVGNLSFTQRLAATKTSLWREGALVRAFPRASPALLAACEIGHAIRGVTSKLRLRQ